MFAAIPLEPISQTDINSEELEKIKKITPLEFYEMGAMKRFMCNLLVAQAEYHNLIDAVEWSKQVGYEEIKINWIGLKNKKIEYFKTHKDVESKFNIKINQIRNEKILDKLDGWKMEKVSLKAITDYEGNILKVK